LWSKNSSEAPLFTFDSNDDYVYDAKWHPTNASLFASCGANGRLDLWDLNKDTEMPITNFDLGKSVLNKIAWSSDGKRITVGDNNGKLFVMNIDKEVYLLYFYSILYILILNLYFY
jgi:dynein intermediate chain